MAGFLIGIIVAFIAVQVVAILGKEDSDQVPPDMEAVKEHIDRAVQYREQLQKLDNMIVDFELLVERPSEICKNVRFCYQSKGGQGTEMDILFSGDYTTQLLLEMLRDERSRVTELLLNETEKIPKRYRQ